MRGQELTAAEQACNNCAAVFPARLSANATNPLCPACRQDAWDRMTQASFGIRGGLADRQNGAGVMAQMSDERFERYILRQLEHFHSARNAREE